MLPRIASVSPIRHSPSERIASSGKDQKFDRMYGEPGIDQGDKKILMESLHRIHAAVTEILASIGVIAAIGSSFWQPRDWILLAAFVGSSLAFGSAVAIVVRRRSRFLRKTTAAQWRLAWLLVVVMASVQALVLWGLYSLL